MSDVFYYIYFSSFVSMTPNTRDTGFSSRHIHLTDEQLRSLFLETISGGWMYLSSYPDLPISGLTYLYFCMSGAVHDVNINLLQTMEYILQDTARTEGGRNLSEFRSFSTVDRRTKKIRTQP